jgi:hypothetical protein
MLIKYLSLVSLFLLPVLSFATGPYDHVDKRVMEMTNLNDDDLFQLTLQLTNPFAKQDEKVRAVYRWITANIEYDMYILKNKNQSAGTAQEVLKRKKSVCSGYAMLFKAMMDHLGIECVIINGHSKGYDYNVGEFFSDKNAHAWNAVKIDDEWRLIDATWGAGYIEKDQFFRSYKDYYFFTPPDELIQTHYPRQRTWQLLDKKVSRQEFENFVLLKPAYFKYGIKVISHQEYNIHAGYDLLVKVFAPPDILMEASIYYGEHQLDQNFVFSQRNGDIFEIRAAFSDADAYILRLFAREKEETTPYNWVLDYRVTTQQNAHAAIGYPKKYGAFDAYNTYLISPLAKFLSPGDTIAFKLRVENCEKLALIQGEKFQFFTKNNDLFEGRFIVPKGAFFIAASRPGSNNFSYLLEYDGWK